MNRKLWKGSSAYFAFPSKFEGFPAVAWGGSGFVIVHFPPNICFHVLLRVAIHFCVAPHPAPPLKSYVSDMFVCYRDSLDIFVFRSVCLDWFVCSGSVLEVWVIFDCLCHDSVAFNAQTPLNAATLLINWLSGQIEKTKIVHVYLKCKWQNLCWRGSCPSGRE